ncbi:hypothetical protein EDB19DRAFT_188075 [Suillus lakei]|nr:hypothetical protein EDB19DRAFT_188075 [Suillus lakei]
MARDTCPDVSLTVVCKSGPRFPSLSESRTDNTKSNAWGMAVSAAPSSLEDSKHCSLRTDISLKVSWLEMLSCTLRSCPARNRTHYLGTNLGRVQKSTNSFGAWIVSSIDEDDKLLLRVSGFSKLSPDAKRLACWNVGPTTRVEVRGRSWCSSRIQSPSGLGAPAAMLRCKFIHKTSQTAIKTKLAHPFTLCVRNIEDGWRSMSCMN